MRWLLTVVLVGVASWSGAAEPNEAEKLFRDMEKKVTAAKSIECVFETKVDGGPKVQMSLKGSVTLGEGDKCYAEGSGEESGKAFKGSFTSDGMKMLGVMDGKNQPKHDTPKQFGLIARSMITRSGALMSFFLSSSAGEKDREFKIDEEYPVTGFKLGKKEKVGDKEAQEVQYVLTISKEKVTLASSVWLDTKTNLPLKRVMTATIEKINITITESCSKLTLDTKVDLKKFELPKE